MRRSLFLFKSSRRSTGQVEVQTKCQNTHMQYSSKLLFSFGLLSPLIGALWAVSTRRPRTKWDWKLNYPVTPQGGLQTRVEKNQYPRVGKKSLAGVLWSSPGLPGTGRRWKEQWGTKDRKEGRTERARWGRVELRDAVYQACWACGFKTIGSPIASDVFIRGSVVL